MGKSSSKKKNKSKQRQQSSSSEEEEERKSDDASSSLAGKEKADGENDQKVVVRRAAADDEESSTSNKKTKKSAPQQESSASSKAAADAKKDNDDTCDDDDDDDDNNINNKTATASGRGTAAANSFESLTKPIALCRGILDYCRTKHFTSMTPVQAATIPLFLSHKDVAVQALTGSGKTLAFIIPIVECIRRRNNPRFKRHQVGALVLSPTRELAHQTHAVACEVISYCRKYDEHLTEPLLLVGGGGSGKNSNSNSNNTRPVTADLEAFRRLGSDILIGTPGRVEDVLTKYSGSSIMDCSELDLLILDEADVLLDMGFSTSLQKILQKLPKMRRTGLFSATTSSSGGATASSTSSITSSLKEWIKKAGMRNPVWIDVAVTNSYTPPSSLPSSSAGETETNDKKKKSETTQSDQQQQQQQATPTSLTNYYLVTPCEEKLSRLVAFLRQHAGEKIIVFFLTCACVEFYGAALQQVFAASSDDDKNICIETLHGKLVQKRREKTMERFRGAEAAASSSSSSVAAASAENHDDNDNSDDDNTNKKKNAGSVLFCTDVAARGLDVSNVHWVVQFDAPQDPAFYIHRVGRCARANRKGSSLLFLTPKEEAYIDFLHNRKVPLVPLSSSNNNSNTIELCTGSLLKKPAPTESTDSPSSAEETKPASTKSTSNETKTRPAAVDDEDIDHDDDETRDAIEDVLPKVRDLVMKDRDILEKGTKAFTSYIRAYKEHRCAFIFRFASLDLGVLATSFCLLRLPKMPELRDVLQRCKGRLPNFTPAGPEVDIYAIAYQDKHREAARQKRLAQDLASGGKNAKLILAEKKKAAKERQAAQRRHAAIEKGRNPDKKRSKHAQLVDDWDEFTNEERLYKKLRKGKITKEEYDDEMYGTV